MNQAYEPVSVCSAKRAVVLVVLEKAEIIVSSQNYSIRSVRFSLPWPTVIKLRKYIHVPYKKIMLSRKNILKRDGYTCSYCGTRENPLTIDHILPRSRGGIDSWENLTTSCGRCNHKKGNRTPEEAGMELKRPAYKPTHHFIFSDNRGIVDESWRPFLFI